MGSCLTIVFAISFTTLLKYMVYGIFALGVVIFVHELGHFLVAKMCGVRCDKFYVGFDPPMPFGLPSALFKFTVGETEYGIGAIPLGGYVKMLGQNDNPAAAAQEAERIRIAREQSDDGTIESEGEFTIDPRSYPAKPVWQRLMIISAGVVMNLIFAVVFGAAAYRYGMLYTPCVVGHTSAGMSGWQVGLQPGDKILQVGRDGKKSEHLRFSNDLAVQVKMRDVNSTVELLVRRYGASEPERIEVELTSPNPEYSDFPFIGIVPSDGFVLEEVPDRNHSSLSVAASKLKKGDKIVGVDGHELRDYATFSRLMATRFDDVIKFTVERKNDDNVELVDVSVAPTPMRWVGLGMKMGPIAAIQKGSPAKIAGLKKGDVIESINGERVTNGIVVPYLLDRLAGQTVEFTVSRAGSEIEISATLRTPTLYRTEPPTLSGYYAAESLGIAFPVTNEIAFVEPESPAEDAGCKVGDRVNHVQSMPKKGTPKPKIYVFSKEIDLQEHPDAWAIAHEKMQYESPNTPMKLTLTDADSDEEKIVELETVASTEWNMHSRGLFMLSENAIHQETDLKKAFGLGLRETKEGLEHVVAVLGKLVGGKISPKNLGGPFTIAASAGHEASQSPSRLLAFLTMLSANVAVLNFLPIPVLDGGHAMFLIYEAIFRKPLDERLAMGLTMVGFVFIVGLMIMVLGLDIHRMGTWLFQ